MNKMQFKVRCVREHLQRVGYVYTVRGYSCTDAGAQAVMVDGVGLCLRRYLVEVKAKSDLEFFVEDSGFSSVDDWWKVVEYWLKGRRKFLYFVALAKAAVA